MIRAIVTRVFVSVAVLFTVASVNAQVKLADFAAQAAQVTEFDVNGLKVIVKRRASAPTVAGGLFIRGGARNVDEKTAGIENLMLTTAVEAGQKMPRATVRRELSRLGSASPGTSRCCTGSTCRLRGRRTRSVDRRRDQLRHIHA